MGRLDKARRGGRTTKTHIAGPCLGAFASIGYVHTIHGLGDGHMCRPAARCVQRGRQDRALGGPVSPGGCRSRASWAAGREPRWKDGATTINDATWQARSRGWGPTDRRPASQTDMQRQASLDDQSALSLPPFQRGSQYPKVPNSSSTVRSTNRRHVLCMHVSLCRNATSPTRGHANQPGSPCPMPPA